MSRAQPAKRPRDGASSSNDPFLEAHNLGITWPIKESEVPKFRDVQSRSVAGTRFLKKRTVVNVSMWAEFSALLKNSGLEAFFKCKAKGYRELMYEFYTTVTKLDGVNSALTCRLNGHQIVITPNLLREIFELPRSKAEKFPPETNVYDAWWSIGGGKPWTSKGGTKSQLIKSPVHSVFHKFIAHALFGKIESNKLGRQELLILWGAVHNRQFNIAGFLFDKLYDCARRKGGETLLHGHIITAIALHQNVISAEQLQQLELVVGSEIDEQTLRLAFILGTGTQPLPYEYRPAYRALALGRREEQVEDVEEEEDYDNAEDAPMPAAPPPELAGSSAPEPAGTSAPDTFSMDRMMSQLASMSGQIHDMFGYVQNAYTSYDARLTAVDANIDTRFHALDSRVATMEANVEARFHTMEAAQEARSRAHERRLRRLERHQHYYFSAMGSIPPPPPSPPPSP